MQRRGKRGADSRFSLDEFGPAELATSMGIIAQIVKEIGDDCGAAV
jgi:hypothetical protein